MRILTDKWSQDCCAGATTDDKEKRREIMARDILRHISQLEDRPVIAATMTRKYSEMLHLRIGAPG